MELIIKLYFDPGLGAMLIQSIVALVAGVLLFSKNLIYKIKSFFGLVKEDNVMENSIDIEEDNKIEDVD